VKNTTGSLVFVLGFLMNNRSSLLAALVVLLMSLGQGHAEPLKDAPTVLHLASGKQVKVISVVKTTLYGSDEDALSLQYTTEIKITDTEELYREVEEVWAAFRPLVEKERLRAAVVTAKKAARELFEISEGAGWAWKQRADGSWHKPDAGDKARVPR
jgi:hypothetical protein